MGAAPQLVDNKVLRGFVPLDGLSPHNFNEVVARLQFKHIEKGGYIFKEGDHDPNNLYLIEGKIELLQNGKKISVIRAGSHDAAHPLAPQQPRPSSALAKTRVTIAYIDKTLLDVYSGTHQDNAYEVRDINASSDDDDWMTRLLQSEAFLRLPPMNIQRMLTRMQAVKLNAFDVVIKEGDEGDAYYTIKHGRCRISRRAADGSETVLAEIADGACFGEDALLSESKRSATITMMTDGELMRLSKKDFLELLNAPLVDHIGYSEAIELINQGAQWLDTRNNIEHHAQCITGSLNIPMPELRDKLELLDNDITYITYCNDGRTASAATFVLGQHGISSRALSNGMSSVDTSLITVASSTARTAIPSKATDDEPAGIEPTSAEIIGFEESLGAKQVSQIKELRSELDRLKKLSEARLKHAKLQAHEQIEKLRLEIKEAQGSQNQSHSHNQDEIKRLKAALYEEQENAAAISTSKLETEHALTKLVGQLRELSKQDEQRQDELKSAREKIAALEQAELTATNSIKELQTQLKQAEQDKSQSQSSLQKQIEQLNSELNIAIDTRSNIEEQLRAMQETVDALTQSEQQAVQQVQKHHQEIEQLEIELKEADDARGNIKKQLSSALETIDTLTSTQQQALQQAEDRAHEVERINEKLEAASRAQRQAEQDVSVLRGKLEGSKEAQQEVVSRLKQQLENATSEHQQTKDEYEVLRTQLSVAEKQLSEKQKTVNDLANDITEKQSTIDQLNKNHDALVEENTRLATELESAKSELTDSNSANDARIKELTVSIEDSHCSNQSLQQDNYELKLKLEDAARENERLQVSISGEIDAEIERLLAEVKTKSSELIQLQSAIDHSAHTIQQLEENISELEKQRQDQQATYQHRIEELNVALKESQHAHKTTEDSANENLRKLAQLDNQLQEKEKKLEETNARIQILETELGARDDSQAALEATVKELEQTRQSLQEKISNYESQLGALNDNQSDNSERDQRLESLEADNENLRNALSSTEEQLKNIRSEFDAARSDTDSTNEELAALKSYVTELEATKATLEGQLATLKVSYEENANLQQRIDTLEQSKQALIADIKANDSNQAETHRKLKEFEQEKTVLIEKITSSEQLIASLRGELEQINGDMEQVKSELSESEITAQKTIEQLTSQLEQASIDSEHEIHNLKQQLDSQINDHQKTNSTLEDLHSNLRTERHDLEKQLHEQRLLREKAEAQANATKLEVEGLRAELIAANQQLENAGSSEPYNADSSQLQRLSADLAKAVEYRKQSEIAKQALHDEVNKTRKEIARLKGENDGHLELRIQLEGQLAILRQQLRTHPAANEIIDNIKNLTDVDNITSIPAVTDIGQTSWESRPTRLRHYFMVIAVLVALVLVGTGSWLFRVQLGLEQEWQSIAQQLGLVDTQVPARPNTIEKLASAANKVSSNTMNTVAITTNEAGTTGTVKTKKSSPATAKVPALKTGPATSKALVAVTPTSRDVTPVPFRVYRNALKDGGAGPVMVEMPAGNFTMGSSVTSNFFEERPHREVKVARFAIAKHEITFAEYDKFAKASKRQLPEAEGWGRDNQPVINVSWQDAADYAAWLSEQTGHQYRLPSESEWEYMARAGTQAAYWWGNEPRGDYANCLDCESKLAGKKPVAVESFDANAFGIKNTAGNVSEWVQDCYHGSYEGAPLDSKAWVTDGRCDKRMVRGGSFRSPFDRLRSSARDAQDIGTRSESIGFRVVREY